MHDEFKAFRARYRDLQEAAGLVGAYEHFEISKIESSHGVPVGVEYGSVSDPMSSGAPEDHGVHEVKLLGAFHRANTVGERGRSREAVLSLALTSSCMSPVGWRR